jgi:alpha-N-arabinofuranosidase
MMWNPSCGFSIRQTSGVIVCAIVCGGLAIVGARGGTEQAGGAVTTLTINAAAPGAAISSTLFGIFFEDINFAADGGIYAEKIKNRSFEFPDALMGWRRAAPASAGSSGTFTVRTDAPPSPQNPHYLRITSKAGTFGVSNDGFRGIGFSKGQKFRFSVLARVPPGEKRAAGGKLLVEFENTRGDARGGIVLEGFTSEWQRYTGTIEAAADDLRGHLRLLLPEAGSIDVDMVSLFPEDTWKGRENGLRRDLTQLLADLKPGFIRFPGGCIVEGRFLDGRYQWKTTIGAPADRRLIVNRWNDEFPHRAAPDYYQSFGLGFFEYFQLAEDIGAEPLPILNCGMACQFNSNELVPLDQIDPYVQDALDLIEFANGPVTSTWGKKRADMGHPAPFNLKFVGVGNEQWGPQYIERYELFAKVLKKKHPEIRLVSSVGPFSQGKDFDYLWGRLRELKAELVDEHYYMPPDWFLTNTNRYDNYPRTGPKIFAGEYAAHAPTIPARGQRPSTLTTALAEAAFMTGLERNADVVELSSYAPLFAHVDAWQWTPNLIWFDNLKSYGTTSYHVQKLFGGNRGTHVLPVNKPEEGLFASASLDQKAGEVIVKLVNPGPAARNVRVDLTGKRASGAGKAFVLTGAPDAENSLTNPATIAPTEEAVTIAAGSSAVDRALPAHSLTVLRVAVQ